MFTDEVWRMQATLPSITLLSGSAALANGELCNTGCSEPLMFRSQQARLRPETDWVDYIHVTNCDVSHHHTMVSMHRVHGRIKYAKISQFPRHDTLHNKE